MNKKLFIPVILAVLLGVTYFVLAANVAQNKMTETSTGNYEVEIYISKGWNLILGSPLVGPYPTQKDVYNVISSDSQIRAEDIKAIFFYGRDYNKYYQVYPNATEFRDYVAGVGSSPENKAYIMQSPMWIYSNKEGLLKYSKTDMADYTQIALENGWNFVTIQPSMYQGTYNPNEGYEGEYFSWDAIKGNGQYACNYEKIYYWNPQMQTWVNLDPAMQIKSYDFDDFLGNGMLIKVTNDCALGTSEQITAPPTLPQEIYNCTDSDNGLDYSVKGHLVDSIHHADYYDVCSSNNTLQEYYCGPQNYQYEFYPCPNGCNDGRCL